MQKTNPKRFYFIIIGIIVGLIFIYIILNIIFKLCKLCRNTRKGYFAQVDTEFDGARSSRSSRASNKISSNSSDI